MFQLKKLLILEECKYVNFTGNFFYIIYIYIQFKGVKVCTLSQQIHRASLQERRLLERPQHHRELTAQRPFSAVHFAALRKSLDGLLHSQSASSESFLSPFLNLFPQQKEKERKFQKPIPLNDICMYNQRGKTQRS